MTELWLSLLTFAALAVLFIIWPLVRSRSPADVIQREQANVALYKEHLADLDTSRELGDIDEEQYRQLKLELDRSLLDDGGAAESERRFFAGGKPYLIALAVLVPLGSVLFYQHNGAAGDWEIQQLEKAKFEAQKQAYQNKQRPDTGPARALAEKLQERLESQPENLQNWFLLARTLMEVGDYGEAANAYREILHRDAGSSSGRVMGELTQAMFMAAGNKVTPEVQKLLKQTLAIEPGNATALGLAGVDAFEAGSYQKAIGYWERALKAVGSNGVGASSLKGGIERAKKAMREAGLEPDSELAETKAAKPADGKGKGKGSQVTVNISLGNEVPNAADQVVFVYARAWKGPKMPLAIQKLKAADLPSKIVLDESMSMAPGMTLAAFPQIELVARLSQSGAPTPQPGDWQATQGPIRLADLSEEVALEINTQIQ
ncbi:MAG: c-type cytochrome biogenesis protein CcmI [Exilibacterium sp.]